MFRASVAAIAASAAIVLGATIGADARPAKNSHGCSSSETMKIPLRDLNKCALDGGSMKCTANGYECCTDGGSYCEWSPYSSRPQAGTDLIPPTAGFAQPPRHVRPDLQPPVGPKAPPDRPQRPDFGGRAGTMTSYSSHTSSGPRVK